MNGFLVDSLQREIAQEKAQGLALTEKRLLAALDAYRQQPPGATAAQRERIMWQLVDTATSFVVQREACGLRDAARILKLYAVPAEVVARMGIRRQSASR
jgi:hypothetical protein